MSVEKMLMQRVTRPWQLIWYAAAAAAAAAACTILLVMLCRANKECRVSLVKQAIR